ncbi:ComEC/Rec2 family competence protein [Aestuariimicrobium ganziense]|uniref:ComEC/Rec2 family competence protein n=1 Tax=Aestuariimicrobium ganziense TaxID=2773677 RepID=UPI0019459ED6|nr:ComEC/Rec2 family competence protein [Aestuariimicrobium ganziense]
MSPSEQRPAAELDLRLVPAAATAWLVVGAGLVQEPRSLLVLAVVGATVLVSSILRGKLAVAMVGVALVASAAAVGVREVILDRSPVADLARERAVVRAQLRLSSDVRLYERKGARPEMATVPASMVWLDARGRRFAGRTPVQLRATGELAGSLGAQPAGAVVEVVGRLSSPEPGDPVAARLQLLEPVRGAVAPSVAHRAVNRVRGALVAAMAHSPPDQAGLVPSLVVGDTSGLPGRVTDDFRATGLTHLTAVSGTNLTLLLVFLLTVARWACVRGRWLWLVQVVGVAAFVALCRAEPSVLRASAMGLVAMAALGRTRDSSRGIRHLCVAVLVLVLLDPPLSRSWGFALSVSATAGILLIAPPMLRAMQWLPRSVAEAVAVPWAAQVVTTPLVVALSGQVPVSGLVANVLVAPFVGPATVLGLVAALAGAVWTPLGVPFGWVAGWCVEPLLLVAARGSGLPGATHAWPPGALAMVVLVGLSLVVALLTPWLVRRRWLALLAAVAVVIGMARPPLVPGWPGDWRVVFCSVGQGDATVIRAGPRAAIMVDVGPEPRVALACLDSLGVEQVPLLVLTHFHADHIGGVEAVLASRRVGLVLTSPLLSPAATADSVSTTARSHGASVRPAATGERLHVGSATWTTLQAGSTATVLAVVDRAESSVENDSSVIGLVTSGEVSVLLAGDAEPAAQRQLVASGTDLRAQVIAMPHHGSARQDEQFWRSTGARLAVASAGLDNDYGHPSGAALSLARGLGMRTVRTDLDGSVAVGWRDGALRVALRGGRPP